MSNRPLIERALARFLTSEQVSSIVGDVQEASISHGKAWAVRAYASALFACLARPLSAFAGATIIGSVILYLLPVFFSQSILRHDPTTLQRIWASSCAVLVGLMSYVTVYLVILYGVRDMLSLTATMLTLSGTVAVLFWWLPPIPLLALLGVFVWLLAGIVSSPIRRSAIGLAGLVGVEVILGMTALVSIGFYGKYITTSLIQIALIASVLYLLIALASCIACSMVHRRTIRFSPQ